MMNAPDLIGTALSLGDTIGKDRVIDQELNGVDAARLGSAAARVLEKAGQTQRIVAGFGHGADADAVRLEFTGARVVDLMLNDGALARKDRSLDRIGRAPAGRRAQQNRSQKRRRGQQPLVALIEELANDM